MHASTFSYPTLKEMFCYFLSTTVTINDEEDDNYTVYIVLQLSLFAIVSSIDLQCFKNFYIYWQLLQVQKGISLYNY